MPNISKFLFSCFIFIVKSACSTPFTDLYNDFILCTSHKQFLHKDNFFCKKINNFFQVVGRVVQPVSWLSAITDLLRWNSSPRWRRQNWFLSGLHLRIGDGKLQTQISGGFLPDPSIPGKSRCNGINKLYRNRLHPKTLHRLHRFDCTECMCHVFRLMNRNAYFWITFDHFQKENHFWGS